MQSSRTYTPKKLINGKVIGKEGLYVAIPDKGYHDCEITVFFEGRALIIPSWSKAEAFRKFPNQFGSGYYMLGYFKFCDNPVAIKTEQPDQMKLL